MPSISAGVSSGFDTARELTSQQLVHNTIGRAAGVANRPSSGLGNRIQFVEEHNARGGSARLVEDVANVALRLTEPHGQELGALDRDEVCGALVGNSLGKHGLTGSRGTVEQDTSGRRHAKLEELLGVLDRILHRLDELALDLLEAANVVPADVGNLDDCNLAQGGRVGHAKSIAEVVHGDAQRVKHLGVDGVFVQINQVHLLADLLHGSFGAERRKVGADVAVSLRGDGREIDIITQLHVLGVDLKNLQATGRVGNANVDLAIEAAVAAQGRVDRVRPVGGGHDDNVGSGLHAVHEGQQLRDDAALDLAVGLVSLRGDGVDLIDEDDGGRVLLGLLKGLAQVGLGLAGHLGHDLGAVDQEEEGARLVGDGSSHERFSGARGAEHEDSAGRLDADGLEQLRVAQRKLDQLADLGHLLAAAANVIVAHLVQVLLLILALDRLALAVDDGVLGGDGVLGRVHLDDLELDLSHAAADGEQVALANGAVGFAEVRGEEDVEDVSGEALDGVGNGQDGDALGLDCVSAA
jgi:hypothetical protein